MKHSLIAIAALAGLAYGCQSGMNDSVLLEKPTIESRTITTAELPSEFSASRTYHYRQPSLKDPEGVLLALLDGGFAVTRAWQPLDDRCLDPLGPTFTLELAAADPDVEDQGFELGVGRLLCAMTLTEYTVSPGGS
jgi:hypothetical protein